MSTDVDTHATEHEHPSPAAYIKVAALLAFVTLVEVGAYYVTNIPDPVLVAALMIMMVVKFALVGLWFMHLRFDNIIFRRFFVTGIVLAMAIYTIVLATFGVGIGS